MGSVMRAKAYYVWRDDLITAVVIAHGGTEIFPTLSGIPEDVRTSAARLVELWRMSLHGLTGMRAVVEA